MPDFSLIRYGIEHRDVWDSIVKKSKNGNFLFLRNYLDYHAHRFNEQSLIVKRKGEPVAVFPGNQIENQLISHSGLTYGGLIYGVDLHAVDVLEIFGLIADRYRTMGIHKITYKAIPHIYHSYPAEEDLYALFRLGARLIRRDIASVVQIENRIKFSSSKRRCIRKAEVSHVEIHEGEFLEDFHRLLSQVLKKFGVKPVHSLDEMQLLKSRFPDEIRLFGAFQDQKLLAGAMIYDFGKIAHGQYAACSDEGRKIGALDYLLAHLIENVFGQHRYYSHGISTEKEGQHLNEGLILQKEGLCGRGVAHDFYELTLS